MVEEQTQAFLVAARVEPADFRRGRVLVIIAALGTLLSALALSVELVAGGRLHGVLLAGVVSNGGALLLLWRLGDLRVAGHLVLGFGLLETVVAALRSGEAASLASLIVLPMAAMAFISPRAAGGWTALCLTAVVSVVVGLHEGWVPSTSLTADEVMRQQLIALSTSVLLAAGLMRAMQRASDRFEAEAAEEGERLAQESAAKSRFLRVVGHELRTPLAGVVGQIELVQDSHSLLDARERATGALASAEALREVIELVLDYASSATVEPQGPSLRETSPLELGALVTRCRGLFEERARGKGLKLQTDLPDAPLWIQRRHTPMIGRALIALLDNAVKYTSSGEVTVTLGCTPRGDQVDIALTVIDHGPGLSAEEFERLSEAFLVDRHARAAHTGLGLGLSLVRRAAELLDAEISVTPGIDRGTHIGLRFAAGCVAPPQVGGGMWEPTEADLMAARRSLRAQERQARAAAAELPEAAAAPESAAHRPRVLVVEDDVVNRQVVQRLLVRQGVEVDTAENGEVGAELAEATRYALIITDLDMPVLDGYGMLARLRAGDGASARSPVVAMTAHGDVDHYELSLAMGMARHLVKPLSRAGLKELLESTGLVLSSLPALAKSGGFVGPRPPRSVERRRAPTVSRASALS